MTGILEKTSGLLAFVRTVESGSFTNASRFIGSSPSAVAKSVARLERRLSVRLLQRSTRTLGLTAEGSAYYERVAPLLRALDDADGVVQRIDDARGLLRVTAPTDFNRLLVTAWTNAFASRHPNLKLELSITDRRIDLIREATMSPCASARSPIAASLAESSRSFRSSLWRRPIISRDAAHRDRSTICGNTPVCATFSPAAPTGGRGTTAPRSFLTVPWIRIAAKRYSWRRCVVPALCTWLPKTSPLAASPRCSPICR
jgi:DNA-binding transcriptional LysR family regulator